MKPPLPILDLPEPIQREMIKKLSPAEAIEMAVKFPDFRKVLSEHKLHATILEWRWNIKNRTWPGFVQIDFEKGKSINLMLPRKLTSRKSKKIRRALKIEDLKFETVDYITSNSLKPQAFVKGFTKWEVLEMYTVFLLDLVRVEKFKLEGQFDVKHTCLDCFVWKYGRKFDRIAVDLRHEKNPVEVFKFLNEQLEVEVYDLEFTSDLPENPVYTTPLSGQTISIQNAGFLRPDSILNSKCVSIELTGTPIRFSLLNFMMKKWINGELDNLKMIWLSYDLIKDQELLDGIETVERSIEDPTGFGTAKLQRSTDGVQASILYYKPWEFRFHVSMEQNMDE